MFSEETGMRLFHINKINWFGRILRKLNIPKKTSTRGTLYHVTKLK